MSRQGLWIFLSRGLLVALVAGLAILTRAGTRRPSIYYMTGPSMEPALEAGDFFLVWKPLGGVKPGHLVIFRFREGDHEGEEFHVLRRLAGLPGDTVEMRDGSLWLNGVMQPWPYRIWNRRASRSELALVENLYNWGPWQVPADSGVLLSDSRGMAGWPDSRFIGFVPLSDLLGRATRTLRGERLR